MAEFWGEVTAIFGTTAGMTVLVLAGLALIGLIIAVYWEHLPIPQTERIKSEQLPISPPPLLAPEIVARGAGGEAPLAWTRFAKAAVLAIIAIAFIGLAQPLFRSVPEGFATAGLRPDLNAAVPLKTKMGQAPLIAVNPLHSAYCEDEASMTEGRFLLCERGAAVKAERLGLLKAGAPLVDVGWASSATSYLRSENHAAPIALGGDLALTPPPTSSVEAYDAFLVIGSAPAADRAVAAERAEGLAAFTRNVVAGADADDCKQSERIFVAVASLHDDGESTTGAARPMVIGLKADPVSSTPLADMRAAAEAILARHGAALGLMDGNLLDASRVCARGTDAL
ncbi:MAG: hypothetical protein V2I43_02685 [Parvularcula sp.]|jgi:hypothetical protein|nr:hypothetical protein [Parvularcula sp.]